MEYSHAQQIQILESSVLLMGRLVRGLVSEYRGQVIQERNQRLRVYIPTLLYKNRFRYRSARAPCRT